MRVRGAYAKGVAKREEILSTALDVIARNGYRGTSIRELAAAVGLSQTGLLHYFGTKEELFSEILRKRDEVDGAVYGGLDQRASRDLIDGLVAVVRHNADVPGLVQLYSQFSAEATEAGHPAHEYFRARYAQFREIISSAIRLQQESGDLPRSLEPQRTAAVLAATIDGLQTQWLMDPSINMADHLAFLWERLSTSPD